ncbi:hypothetical protein Fot_42938 [Forsythia ovata]|uniref:Uncharacterized protein n=1 Tax=Forsythia ovata TaxID=205694 RepID=A0ABD1RNA2_9LAMI
MPIDKVVEYLRHSTMATRLFIFSSCWLAAGSLIFTFFYAHSFLIWQLAGSSLLDVFNLSKSQHDFIITICSFQVLSNPTFSTVEEADPKPLKQQQICCSMEKSLKVAVIGPGVAGLVMEKSDQLGRTWVYDPRVESDPLGLDPNREIVHGSLYSSLCTNFPRHSDGL